MERAVAVRGEVMVAANRVAEVVAAEGATAAAAMAEEMVVAAMAGAMEALMVAVMAAVMVAALEVALVGGAQVEVETAAAVMAAGWEEAVLEA